MRDATTIAASRDLPLLGQMLPSRVTCLRHPLTWRDAPHVGVVAPARHEEHDFAAVKNGCHDGDVRQVAAARQLRVIGDQDVALLQAFPPARAALAPVPQLHRRDM